MPARCVSVSAPSRGRVGYRAFRWAGPACPIRASTPRCPPASNTRRCSSRSVAAPGSGPPRTRRCNAATCGRPSSSASAVASLPAAGSSPCRTRTCSASSRRVGGKRENFWPTPVCVVVAAARPPRPLPPGHLRSTGSLRATRPTSARCPRRSAEGHRTKGDQSLAPWLLDTHLRAHLLRARTTEAQAAKRSRNRPLASPRRRTAPC
mmetsp:Transcript_8568/g.20834  ORF Transcript_8568/g.20834 Transcript_8568/m.20834 type:complete len:207 (-) Transcript_8568:1953-2573(-)